MLVDPDIRRASSLPGRFYTSEAIFALIRERVLARGWHVVADEPRVAAPGRVLPFTLLPSCLDEPLVLTRDGAGALHCLSNVCTHRGTVVVHEAGEVQGLRCRYHGRRFALDGRFLSMPEFEGVEGFPSAADDLRRVPSARLGPLVFAGVDPAMPFEDLVAPVRAAAATLGVAVDAMLDRTSAPAEPARDYDVGGHWALYCDNYLEGFHVPFVHAGLAATIDYGSYRTELSRWGTVQIAQANAKTGDDAFDGTTIAGLYFFLFPATMLNFYPWGLSVNAIRPLGIDRTRVSYATYVTDASRRGRGAGADLHRVEMEDEAVVEAVQRGVRSRLYRRGRYSPAREAGVHHFHRMLVEMIGEDAVVEALGGTD
jgi:choline monooxygenase